MKKMSTNSIKLDPTDNVWEQRDLGLHAISIDVEEVIVRVQLHICINKCSRMIVDSYATIQK